MDDINTKQKSQIPKIFRAGKGGVSGIKITLFCVGCVALPTVIVVPSVISSVDREVASYTCEGVDEDWLKDHPFDASDYPEKFNFNKGIRLGEPNIPGYHLLYWHLEGEKEHIKPGTYKSDFFKVNKEYKFVATYEPIVYNVELKLNGGHLSIENGDEYDGHTYQKNGDSFFSSYICLDDPFKLPVADKDGYDFSLSGWKTQNDNHREGIIPSSDLSDFSLEADWSIHPYNISYSFTGEGVDEFESEIINNNAETFNYEESVIFNKPSLDGYTFDGWFDKSGKKVDGIPMNTVPNNDLVEIEGRFTPITYTITYADKSNSDHSKLPTSYKRCSPDITVPDINPTGYNFLGWVDNSASTFGYSNVIPHGSTENKTFTASVNLITYTISFVCDGIDDMFKSNFNLAKTTIKYNVESTTFPLPEAKCPGYKFLYFLDENGDQIESISTGSIYGDKVYTACFEPITYTVSLTNTRTNQKASIDYTIEDAMTFDVPTSKGYTFGSWVDANGNEYTEIKKGDATKYGNLELTSIWTLNTYSLSYSFIVTNNSGQLDNSKVTNNNPVSYNFETDVALANPTANGYTFVGWTYGSVTNPTKDLKIDKHTLAENLSFVGHFTRNTYNITYVLDGGINNGSNPDTFTVEDTKTLYNPTKTGYTFQGWQNENGVVVTSIALGTYKNITLTALWTINSYTVTATSSDTTKGTVTGGGSYNYGSTVTLVATPADNYELEGWYQGDTLISTDEEYEFTLGAEDVSFEARFKAIVYTITRSYRQASGGSIITQTIDYTVESDGFTLPELSSDIQTFIGWRETVTNVTYAANHVFGNGMSGSLSLEAVWSLNGQGTEASPYEIYTVSQLENITDMSAHYKLMNDLSITSSKTEIWLPVGTSDKPFNGVLDGNGKTIELIVASNSIENDEYTNYFGIFGYMGTSSKVKNLKIVGSVGASDKRFVSDVFGAVAAYSSGVIDNVTQSLTCYLTSNNTNVAKIGGLVGELSSGSILNSKCTVVYNGILNVDATSTTTIYQGGLVGYTTGGFITDCFVNQTIVCKAGVAAYAGGFCGARNEENTTHIGSSIKLSGNYPFDGAVSTSVIDPNGNAGMAQYTGGNKCIVGKQVYSAVSGTYASLVADYYYYIVSPHSTIGVFGMSWMLFTGNMEAESPWDYLHPINEITYNNN